MIYRRCTQDNKHQRSHADRCNYLYFRRSRWNASWYGHDTYLPRSANQMRALWRAPWRVDRKIWTHLNAYCSNASRVITDLSLNLSSKLRREASITDNINNFSRKPWTDKWINYKLSSLLNLIRFFRFIKVEHLIYFCENVNLYVNKSNNN